VQAGAAATSSFQVTWTTSAAANSSIDYGTTASYGTSTPVNSAMVTNHQLAITNLTIGTLYHFRARSTDANNNSAVSGDMTFATAGDTVAPTVSITSPAANATLSGTVNVAVTASDNVGVASVQLKIDNANSGAAVTAAPFVISVNTTLLSNANHILTAVATDAAGNSTTSAQVAVKVSNTTPDTTPPTVSLTAPANGATVSSTISITATASDNVGVASVQFQLDGANFGSIVTAAPYSVSWNTTTASNGSHTLLAIAKDAAGNSTTSASVTVTVSNSTPDTTPPTVSVTAPAGGATVSGTVSVTANASDNVGVASVQFQLDGANLGSLDTASPYAASWNTTTASNGSHVLLAIAKDAAGNSTTSAGVTVTVSNTTTDTTAPSVPGGLTATAASSSQINLSWNASTDNVGVTGYKIFRGGTLVTTSSTTSYLDAGLTASTSFTYTVAAFDAAGNTSAQSASATATTLASSGSGIPSTLGWFQIPNTKLQSVCPPNNFGGSSYGFFDSCAAVIYAWGGGMGDTTRNRLIVWGGGHTDYSGNEVYALDLNSLTMLRLNNPAVPVATGCPQEALSGPTPNSRHTTDQLAYITHADTMSAVTGSLASCGNAAMGTWTLNFSNLQWTQRTPSGGQPNYNGGIAATDYDPNTKNVFIHTESYQQFWSYNFDTNAYKQLADWQHTDYHMTAVVDPKRKLFIMFGGDVSNDGGVRVVDISGNDPTYATQNWTSQVTGCGPTTTAMYPGLAYDPVQDRIVAWAGGNTVYIFNPDTKSCTSATYANGPGAQQVNGTNKRFRYFPALGVFALVNDANQNAFTLRLTPSGGGGTGAAPAISGVSASSITTSGAAVTWTTDIQATTQVEYGTTTAYGTMTTLNSTLVTSHSTALSGLAVNTLYHYRVHSKNSAGTESISGDFAFQTNNTADATPPTISITAPAAGATVSGTVSVTANASDNVGVTNVQFMLDGANLGSADMTTPYVASWNTTAAANGAHTLTAQASDAAGNVGNAVAVAVTVSNTGTTNAATLDFQARCALPGVLACQGFDSSAVASCHPLNYSGSGMYVASDDNTTCPVLDTTTSRSGASSLLFTIPKQAGSDAAGSWRQMFQSSLTGTDATSAKFAPPGAGGTNGNHFYIQYAQKMDAPFITTRYPASGGGSTYWKQQIIANWQSSCGGYELTTVNEYNNQYPAMYANCGSVHLYNGSFHEQGDYNCDNNNPTPQTCFMYPANTWVTYYYDITLNSTGGANSVVKAYVSVNGQPYQQWINISNYAQGADTPNYYDMVYLFPYMTGRDSSQAVAQVAHTWYDELIISQSPIPAPAVPPAN